MSEAGNSAVQLTGVDAAAPRGPLPARRGWWRAAVAVTRRHWPAAVLLAAGLVLRVLAQVAYRPALFLDATRYLYNSYGNDPVGYEGPLRAILWLGNFDAVVAVQHLLGLYIAVLIYLVLLRRGASRWLAALAMAPVLLDAYELQNEQTILPGTFFQALIVTGFALLLWRPDPGWRRAAAGGLALGTSAIFAQVGEGLIVPAAIYLIVCGGRWWRGAREARRVAGRTGALCAAFALPILSYCTVSYLVSGAFFLSHTGVTSLYGRMAAAADCATLRLPAGERALCPDRQQQAQGPDWLEYAPQSPDAPYYAHLPRAEVNSLVSDFNHRVLAQQPLRVLASYSRDVVKLYALVRVTDQGDTQISRWQFQPDYPYHPPNATEAIVLRVTRQFGGGPPTVWKPVALFLRGYQLHGGFTPGPLLLVFTLASLAGPLALVRRRSIFPRGRSAGFGRRTDPRTRQLALGCLLLSGSGALLLLVSDVFEYSWRYQLPALVTLVPGGVLGLGVILEAVRARRAVTPGPGLSNNGTATGGNGPQAAVLPPLAVGMRGHCFGWLIR